MPDSITAPEPSALDLEDTPELAVPDGLWDIHDVARFLQRCENTARKYIKAWDDSPTPVFSDGSGAMWDPRDWWTWATTHKHKARKNKAHHSKTAEVRKLRGTKTRV